MNTNYITKLKMELFNDQNQSSGQIVLSCMMKPSNEALEVYSSNISLPKEFEKGVVRVTKIIGRDLVKDQKHDKDSSKVTSPFLMFDYADNTGSGGDESTALKSESGMQYTQMGKGNPSGWCAVTNRVSLEVMWSPLP